METFYVFTMRGHRPLGTVQAADAHDAQGQVDALYGRAVAAVFPRSHTDWTERLLARAVQGRADKVGGGQA